jgi:hypothetical protein
MKRFVLCVACACGSSPPPATPPAPVEAAPATSPPVDAAAPDAGPSPELAAAPAWIFRYNAPPRVETWTLRHLGGEAIVVVETAQATTTYLGTATEGATLALSVATATAKVTLDCKHAKRAIGDTCKARKAPTLDVLDCYHPDFTSPMTFALAPGVEFAASCNGYQRLP